MIGRALLRFPLRARLLRPLPYSGQTDVSARLPIVALALRSYATPGRPKKVVGEPSRPVKRAVKRAASEPNTGDSAAEELVEAKKRNAVVKKKKKSAKKTLSPEQEAAAAEKAALKKQQAKASAEKKKQRARVSADKQKLVDLRKQALEPPVLVKVNAWNVFTAERSKGISIPGTQEERQQLFTKLVRERTEAWKSLSPAELEHYNHGAAQARQASQAEYKRWVESHSPEEIHKANAARAVLRREAAKDGKGRRALSKWSAIHDERAVKRPINAFTYFSVNRHSSGDFRNISLVDRSKLISQEWKALSEEEKKKYFNLQHSDRERYASEFQETFGHPASAFESGHSEAVAAA